MRTHDHSTPSPYALALALVAAALAGPRAAWAERPTPGDERPDEEREADAADDDDDDASDEAEAAAGEADDEHASTHRGSLGGESSPMRTEVDPSGKAEGRKKLVEDLDVRVVGSVSFNANYKAFPNAARTGPEGAGVSFERIAFGLEGTYRGFVISADYRFYGKYGTLHHAFIGYKVDDVFELDLGVHRVPFGILPYASHNWFETLPYYVGLADDYDVGAKAIVNKGGFDLQLAYYVKAERSQFGQTIDSSRYSYDIVATDETELGASGVTTTQANEERHTGAARLAYKWEHRGEDATEIGVSALAGGIRNRLTARYGSRWAAALHYTGSYRGFSLQAEALYYQMRPQNPAGEARTWVTMGAWDAPYRVASEGFIAVANIGYRIPLAIKAFDWIMFYNDHSIMLKPKVGFDRTQMNVTGLLLANRFIYLYVDTATGRNHPWFSPEYGSALAEGEDKAKWWVWLNLSLGFYM